MKAEDRDGQGGRAVNADGSADDLLIPEDDSGGGVDPLLPSWSPSGLQIVYVAVDSDGRRLVTMARDGTDRRTLDLGGDLTPTTPVWTSASAFTSRPAKCGEAPGSKDTSPASKDTSAPRLSRLKLQRAKVRRGRTLALSRARDLARRDRPPLARTQGGQGQ